MHDPNTAAIIVHASALFRLALGLSTDHPVTLGERTSSTRRIVHVQDAVSLLQPVIRESHVEVLQALYLDRNDRVLAQRVLNTGTESRTLITPRQVLQPAMQLDAHSIFIAHNHPCGDPTPSTQDVRATHMLVQAARPLGVQVRDHLVLTQTQHYSMREEGLLGPSSLHLF
jgi:DNA repair protein RadC